MLLLFAGVVVRRRACNQWANIDMHASPAPSIPFSIIYQMQYYYIWNICIHGADEESEQKEYTKIAIINMMMIRTCKLISNASRPSYVYVCYNYNDRLCAMHTAEYKLQYVCNSCCRVHSISSSCAPYSVRLIWFWLQIEIATNCVCVCVCAGVRINMHWRRPQKPCHENDNRETDTQNV